MHSIGVADWSASSVHKTLTALVGLTLNRPTMADPLLSLWIRQSGNVDYRRTATWSSHRDRASW